MARLNIEAKKILRLVIPIIISLAFAFLVMLAIPLPVMGTITCNVSAGIAISNLSAYNPKQNSIDLVWTTPESGPHAFSYFYVCYSKAIILSDNWDKATRATGAPVPVAVASQGMTVSGLDSNIKYYFAMIVVDVEGMISALSNIAAGSTLAVPTASMSKFKIDYAKFEFSKKPGSDGVNVQGKFQFDIVNGDGVDISELVTVTVGPVSETITMVAKGRRREQWQYSRPKGYKGIIKDMTINRKNGEFDILMDKVDLGGVTNPVTISIQIGDDIGQQTILMGERKYYWEYRAPSQRHWWEWWR